MRWTVKSKRLKRDVTFFCSGGFDPHSFYDWRYIFINLNGKSGCLGNQICEKGELRGATLVAYSEDDFISTAKKWWKQYLKNRRDSYLDFEF